MESGLKQTSVLIRLLHSALRANSQTTEDVETIFDHWLDYFMNTALGAPLALLISAVIIALFAVGYSCGGCCGRKCCPCCREPDLDAAAAAGTDREGAALLVAKSTADDTILAPLPTKPKKLLCGWIEWSLLASAVTLASCAVLFWIIDKSGKDGREVTSFATDVEDYRLDIIAQANDVIGQVRKDAFVLDAIFARNLTTVDNSTVESLRSLQDIVQQALNVSADLIDQVDQDYGISGYVVDGNRYIDMMVLYGQYYAGWILLLWVLAVTVFLVRYCCTPKRGPSCACCYSKTVVISASVLIALMSIPLVVSGVVLYFTTIVMSDAVIQPDSIINLKLQNQTVALQFIRCTDPLHGGPINENLDSLYAQINDTSGPADQFELYTRTAPDPLLHVYAVDLQNNITETLSLVNSTRYLMSCTRAHGLVSSFLTHLAQGGIEDLFYIGQGLLWGFLGLLWSVVLLWEPWYDTKKKPSTATSPPQHTDTPVYTKVGPSSPA